MCVCACVCACVPHWWIRWQRFEINAPFCHHLLGHKKKPFNDVFGDVVAHDLDPTFLRTKIRIETVSIHWTWLSLAKMTDQILLLIIYRKSLIGFRMVYLHFISVPSKVKVKVMQICIVNISKTATDWANIAIANIQDVAYWLSIGVVTFDLDQFLRSSR